MVIKDQDFAITGGLTDQETKLYNMLNYDMLKLPEFVDKEVEVSNAIHIIQVIFMWRCMIRLSDGKFWKKYDLPYTNYFTLDNPPTNMKYQKIVQDYLDFHEEFKSLEPYHLDDVKRAINTLFSILKD